MKVILLSHTPEPEKIVAGAAKLCYSSSSIENLYEELTEDNVDRFLNVLMSLGHESPIEHVSFTFGIEGVSRALSHQLVRHRIASYSQQSQRYVDSKFEYVIPPEIANNETAKEVYLDQMENAYATYKYIAAELYNKYIEKMAIERLNELNIELDKDPLLQLDSKDKKEIFKIAHKKAIEDARYSLPNAATTKIIVTMNARSLINFFHHRCCDRAQWEIREMANVMLDEVKKVAPTLFKYAGPNCVNGPCTEGKMSCGKAKEMKEKYLNM